MISTGTGDGSCLGRFRLAVTPRLMVFVHRISRPGQDPHPHDHPWAVIWSWVIWGGFTEQVWPDKQNPARSYPRRRGLLSRAGLPRGGAHRITGVTRTAWVVTVARHGYGPENWGFWVPVTAAEPRARCVQWRLYTSGERLTRAEGGTARGTS